MRFEENEEGYAEIMAEVPPKVLRPMGSEIVDRAKRYVPVLSGKLRESITGELVDNETYQIGSDLQYAASVETGSRPHFIPHGLGIDPGVHHPGGPAQPYLRPALYQDIEE